MKLQPIVYTTSVEASAAFYALVLGVQPAYASRMWTSFSVAGANLGIHHVDSLANTSRVGLSLVADSLEEVVERLAAAKIPLKRGIEEETFGRSLVVEDPDGSQIQINQHEGA